MASAVQKLQAARGCLQHATRLLCALESGRWTDTARDPQIRQLLRDARVTLEQARRTQAAQLQQVRLCALPALLHKRAGAAHLSLHT